MIPTRRNRFDQAAGEWLRSKTFRWIVIISCALPVVLICSTVIGIICIIILAGLGWTDAARWLVGIGG